MFNCDAPFEGEGAGIRIRGNSSAANPDTAPYKLKFNTKRNLLGLNGGNDFKTWVLLRSNSNLCAAGIWTIRSGWIR